MIRPPPRSTLFPTRRLPISAPPPASNTIVPRRASVTPPSFPRTPRTNRAAAMAQRRPCSRSEEHTSELQSHSELVCRLLLEKKKKSRQPHGKASHHKCTAYE